MDTWRDYTNYRRVKNDDGSYRYYVILDNAKYVKVSEKIYNEHPAYARKKFTNDSGSGRYYVIDVDKFVEVSEVVYKEYTSFARKMKNMELDLKRNRTLQNAKGKPVLDEHELPITLPEREISLDKLMEEGWDFPSSATSTEDIVLGLENAEVEELHHCIALLDDDEQDLIQALFFDGKSEQEYADMLGVTRQAVNKKKLRILKKLRELMEEGF